MMLLLFRFRLFPFLIHKDIKKVLIFRPHFDEYRVKSKIYIVLQKENNVSRK